MTVSRTARESALRMLYQREISRETPERVREIFWSIGKAEAHARNLANRLFDGVVERLEEIDALLKPHLEAWRMERLGALERNILRLGTCELLMRTEVSARTVIEEAVELARAYSSDESAAFTNGVLDAVRRGMPQLEGRRGRKKRRDK